MTDQINITYTPATGDIEFTTARKTNSLDEAVAAIGDYITRLNGGETKKALKPAQEVKQEAAPMPRPKATKPKQARNGRHMWTDDEKMLAIKMYQRGEPLERIASRFFSTPQSVQKIMQKNGIRRPWPTKGNPSKVAEAEPEAEAVPAPSSEEEPIVINRDVEAEARRLNEELEAQERQRKADLREYRKQHPKPYYLN